VLEGVELMTFTGFSFEPRFVQLALVWTDLCHRVATSFNTLIICVVPRTSDCLCLISDFLLVTKRFFSLLRLDSRYNLQSRRYLGVFFGARLRWGTQARYV
jgi:hypothetical protein